MLNFALGVVAGVIFTIASIFFIAWYSIYKIENDGSN